MTKIFKKDLLQVKIYDTRDELGKFSAAGVASKIRELLKQKETINIIFAAAPSQNEFLESLIKEKYIDWSRINGFHMDEYIGLSKDAPQGFGNFLKAGIFDHLPFKSVHYLNGQCTSPEDECERYGKLLSSYPTDIVCMGIGENAHIAFNDPAVANFNDPAKVKVVPLDEVCRQQQVNDGCFNSFSEVPERALTLTVPTLFSASYLFCMVPGKTKATAVYNTINQSVVEKYPATILRKHKNAILYIEKDSACNL